MIRQASLLTDWAIQQKQSSCHSLSFKIMLLCILYWIFLLTSFIYVSLQQTRFMELSGRPKKQNVLTWSQTPNDCMKSNKKLKSLEKYYLIEFRRAHLAEMFVYKIYCWKNTSQNFRFLGFPLVPLFCLNI